MPRFKKEQCLTIIKDDGNIGKYAAVLCKCNCGKIVRCKKTHVKTGKKKSCGCLSTKCEFVSQFIMRMYWTSLLLNAKCRNLSVQITPDDLDKVLLSQEFKCKLSGIPISLPKTSHEFLYERSWTASVDRIDSNKDYVVENIQFVHKDINLMKMSLSNEQFIQYCKAVAISS